MVYMKRIGIWIVVCLLSLHAVYMEEVSSEVHDDYEWTMEPRVDGSVHVVVKVTLGSRRSSFSFSFWKSHPIENIKVWEAENGAPFNITEADEGDKTRYTFEFEGFKKKGFQFVVEYDWLGRIEETYYGAYDFNFGWTSPSETTHTATVILPKNHELLYTKYLEPQEVSSSLNQVTIVFTEEVPEDGTFDFSLMFSLKGVQLLKQADSNFHLGKYKEAKEAYKDAIRFYSQFSKLYNRDKVVFIAELEGFVKECEAFLEEERIKQETQEAENKYEEAMTAFNNEEYEKAEQLFKEAQTLYESVNSAEKADECQEYIDQCVQVAEQQMIRSEADTLFSEGETNFEQQLYEDAKAKFEEALAKYTELGDEEKINECNEWISSCENELSGGFCMGSSLVFVVLLGAVLAYAVKKAKVRRQD